MREPAVDERAEALLEERRFCEWLDATAALASGWPHSPVSARWWLLQECEVERVRDLAQIRRNPPPGAKGYRRPDEKGKRKPGQGRR